MAELIEITQSLSKVEAFSPLRRMLLTATGTLQGMLSAYFGKEVTVEVKSQTEDGQGIQRQVLLVADELVVCKAFSTLVLDHPQVMEAVLSQNKGIGQILETLGLRPAFELISVGTSASEFWRTYELTAPGVKFTITESFPQGLYP